MVWLNPIKHEDGKPDYRYTIEEEYSGEFGKRHVSRFCGEWIGARDTRAKAVHECKAHWHKRQADL